MLQLRASAGEGGEMCVFSPWQRMSAFHTERDWHVDLWQLSQKMVPADVLDGRVWVSSLELDRELIWQRGESYRRRQRRVLPLHELWEDEPEEAPRASRMKRRRLGSEGEGPFVGNPLEEAPVHEEQPPDIAALSSDSDVLLELEEERGPEAAGAGEEERLMQQLFEEVQAANAVGGDHVEVVGPNDDAEAAAIPVARVLERPGRWGAFRFSRKQPRVGGAQQGHPTFGSYEVTCPFHVLSKDRKSLCKKAIALEGSSEADLRLALQRA